MRKILYCMISLFFSILLTSCNSLKIQECLPIYAMDTTISVTFYNTKNYQKHYSKIKEIYYLYDSISNDFEENEKNVAFLNKNRSMNASTELIDLINASVLMKEKTNGYYNPFVGRLSHLWKDAIKNNQVLDKETINNEVNVINNTSIVVKDNSIELVGDGNLDLGGIAKGYATQKVQEYLQRENITSYLINAGSSNILVGHKNKEIFKIGLEKPYHNSFIKIVPIKNNAIGTSSGKYQNTIIDGVRYHHLLNPFTGIPSNIYDNVNVMCNDSMLCDVYATAIFSMDLDTAKEFVSNNKIEVILFKDDKIIYETDGWNTYA